MQRKIIVIARCRDINANGDYTLAASIAIDLVDEISKAGEKIDVVLSSTLDGIAKFENLYGKAINGRLTLENRDIGFCALELLDVVDSTVLAVIEANRCKYAPADILKRVLSPNTKFLFIEAANQPVINQLLTTTHYRHHLLMPEQPGIYEHFSVEDIMLRSCGLGNDRIGVPTIKKAEKLAALSAEAAAKIPSGNYGFIYLTARKLLKEKTIIAQYMRLSPHDTYVLVGDFIGKTDEIKQFIVSINGRTVSNPFPHFYCHKSLEYPLMRRMIARSSGTLVVTTGTMSTLEAMFEEKLPFYQYRKLNVNFITSVLCAIKSLCASDTSLPGNMPALIIELSTLLFAKKPLDLAGMRRTEELLAMPSVTSRLVESNGEIIRRANGTLAYTLLSFINEKNRTQAQIQFQSVCLSLRKNNESMPPKADQALRRAAAAGRLFEMKVLLQSMSNSEIDMPSADTQRSALHWACIENQLDAARILVNRGAALNERDIHGKTPLHYAIEKNHKEIISLLVKAGACLDIPDEKGKLPCDLGGEWIKVFIQQCRSEHSFRA